MALLTELPSEILDEIILQLFISSQDLRATSSTSQHSVECIRSHNVGKVVTSSFTSGIHALSDIPSPDQSISIERNHLRALALTNRRLASRVAPLLYRLVELKMQERFSDKIGPVQQFMLILSINPTLVEFVHSLSFVTLLESDGEAISSQYQNDRSAIERVQRGDEPFQDIATWSNASHALEPSLSLGNYFSVIPLSAHYTSLLARLPRLKALKLDTSWNPVHQTYCGAARRVLMSPSVQNLTELSLTGSLLSESFDFQTIFKVFQLPNLKTLYLSGLTFRRAMDLTPNERPIIKPSTIVELILDGCYFSEDSLNTILKLPQGLQKLGFTFAPGAVAASCVAPPGIIRCLKSHGKTLKSMCIRKGPADWYDLQLEKLGPITGETFPVLEHLGLPLSLFSDKLPCHTLIPRTLKHLHLFAYNRWSISGWSKHVEEIFEAKRSGFLELDNLRVEYWLSAENLSAPDDSIAAGRLEGIFDEIERLVVAGKDVGIHFEVSIDDSEQVYLYDLQNIW